MGCIFASCSQGLPPEFAVNTVSAKKMLESYNIGNDNWRYVPMDEFKTMVKANRSNCTLSTKKLKEKYDFELMSERVAIKLALVNMSNE